ncbi:MAG TPA: hypothetical protein VH280_21975 [Verrucomicrobiae bacterium]|jgi:hypothetical protein|nr:hypothetical protein [Verrucomicrobiae bacterium]
MASIGPENKSPGQTAIAAAATPVTLEKLPTVVPGFYQLPLGTALNESQAQSMAADRAVRLIVTAGAVDCGKTTLLTTVYELFQSGPVRNAQFAGCETLPAFEQRCHLSRADSENDKADTGRTVYDGPRPEYLHLKLHNTAEEDSHTDFLFTDVSGEMFEYARNSPDECKRLTFLLRASHLVVFLDCEKAVQPDRRWGMVQDAKSLLQSCLDSNMIPKECYVTVVWAKTDYFKADKNTQAVEQFVAGVERDFTARFGSRLKHFKFHSAAARPTRFPNLKMGFGVKELLADWVAHWPQDRSLQLEPPAENNGERESEKFAQRHNALSGNA